MKITLNFGRPEVERQDVLLVAAVVAVIRVAALQVVQLVNIIPKMNMMQNQELLQMRYRYIELCIQK